MGNSSEFHSERNYYLQNWYFSHFVISLFRSPVNYRLCVIELFIIRTKLVNILDGYVVGININFCHPNLEMTIYVLTKIRKSGKQYQPK